MNDDNMYEVPLKRLEELTSNIEELERKINSVYSERNQVVVALSKVFMSHLTKHVQRPDEDDNEWDQEWMNVVCIHLPQGHVTWHIHVSELPLFKHLNDLYIPCTGYDGYSTDEKYRRLGELRVLWGLTGW